MKELTDISQGKSIGPKISDEFASIHIVAYLSAFNNVFNPGEEVNKSITVEVTGRVVGSTCYRRLYHMETRYGHWEEDETQSWSQHFPYILKLL